jgi:membrane fusion protein, multidrug efflux system
MSSIVIERVTHAAPGFRLSRRSLRRLALAGVVAIAGLAAARYGYDWWTAGRFIESTDDAYVGADVTVIAPKVAGLIAEVLVTDNQAVRAGDVLARIDDRDYRAVLARAEGAVAAARAALANVGATRRLQNAMIGQARAEVAAMAAEVSRAALDVARYRLLASSQFASAQRFQQADADHKKGVAAADKALAALDAAERQLEVIGTQEQQAEAALAEAIAERDLARVNLDDTVLRAPVDGTVGNRSARPGGFAAVGAALLAIVPAEGLWVDANFKETQLARLRPGQTVAISVDALPGRAIEGNVASVSPASGSVFSLLPADNATGNFTKIVQRLPVRIRVPLGVTGERLLRPGMSVVVSVDTRDQPKDGLPVLRHAANQTP